MQTASLGETGSQIHGMCFDMHRPGWEMTLVILLEQTFERANFRIFGQMKTNTSLSPRHICSKTEGYAQFPDFCRLTDLLYHPGMGK